MPYHTTHGALYTQTFVDELIAEHRRQADALHTTNARLHERIAELRRWNTHLEERVAELEVAGAVSTGVLEGNEGLRADLLAKTREQLAAARRHPAIPRDSVLVHQTYFLELQRDQDTLRRLGSKG